MNRYFESGLGLSEVEGIVTDGDLRRLFQRQTKTTETPPTEQPVESFITRSPKQISADSLAAEALKLMEDNEITILAVVDSDNHLQGVIHLHDLIRAGLA